MTARCTSALAGSDWPPCALVRRLRVRLSESLGSRENRGEIDRDLNIEPL